MGATKVLIFISNLYFKDQKNYIETLLATFYFIKSTTLSRKLQSSNSKNK